MTPSNPAAPPLSSSSHSQISQKPEGKLGDKVVQQMDKRLPIPVQPIIAEATKPASPIKKQEEKGRDQEEKEVQRTLPLPEVNPAEQARIFKRQLHIKILVILVSELSNDNRLSKNMKKNFGILNDSLTRILNLNHTLEITNEFSNEKKTPIREVDKEEERKKDDKVDKKVLLTEDKIKYFKDLKHIEVAFDKDLDITENDCKEVIDEFIKENYIDDDEKEELSLLGDAFSMEELMEMSQFEGLSELSTSCLLQLSFKTQMQIFLDESQMAEKILESEKEQLRQLKMIADVNEEKLSQNTKKMISLIDQNLPKISENSKAIKELELLKTFIQNNRKGSL